jgi:hypothetical protein
VVDLGTVDLLVEQGFYSSRTDFMVTAIRNLLAPHAVNISEAVAKDSMVVGVHAVGRKVLEDLPPIGKNSRGRYFRLSLVLKIVWLAIFETENGYA